MATNEAKVEIAVPACGHILIEMLKTFHFPACLLLFCMLTCNVHSLGGRLSAETMTSKADQIAVKKVISDFVDDWNRHDSKALADLHTEDANVINIFGQWIKGRNDIEATWHKVHTTVFANSKMVMDVDQLKFPAPNVAVINGTMELLNVPPEVAGRCHYIRVLVKSDAKWLISEFQNTVIRPGDPAKK